MSEVDPSIFKMELSENLRELATRSLAKIVEKRQELGTALRVRANAVTDRFLRGVNEDIVHPDRSTIESGVQKLTYLFSRENKPAPILGDTLDLVKLYYKICDKNVHQTANAFDLYATYAYMYKEDLQKQFGEAWDDLPASRQFWDLHGYASAKMRDDLLPPPRTAEE